MNVLLVGGGRGGAGILELCRKLPDVDIVGVVDMKTDAVAIQLARQMGIRAYFTDVRDALKLSSIELF